MKCIDDLIKKIQDRASGYDDDYMIAHLELVDKLCEISKGADTSSYVDKIAQNFCAILETQQDIIEDLKIERNSSNTGMPAVKGHSNYLPALQSAAVAENKEPEAPFKVPEDGKFESSSQVKEAFVAYLKSLRKNGEPFSHTTVYDYSSRINKLCSHFVKEWESGKLEGKLQIGEAKFEDSKSYLNVYNNLELFKAFVLVKEKEIDDREREGRPFSAEELAGCPLNNWKNLRNTNAALTKFGEFKDKVDKLAAARGGV